MERNTAELLKKLYPDKRAREINKIAPHIESYYRQQQIYQHIHSYKPIKEISKWNQIIGSVHSLKVSLASFLNSAKRNLIKPYWWIRLQLQRRRKLLKELAEVQSVSIVLGGKKYTMLEIANLYTSTNNLLDLEIASHLYRLNTHQNTNCSVCGLKMGTYFDYKHPERHWLCSIDLADGYTPEYIRDCMTKTKRYKE